MADVVAFRQGNVSKFDCIDCGTPVLRFDGGADSRPQCATCLWFPDWFKVPEVRQLLDPAGLATVATPDEAANG